MLIASKIQKAYMCKRQVWNVHHLCFKLWWRHIVVVFWRTWFWLKTRSIYEGIFIGRCSKSLEKTQIFYNDSLKKMPKWYMLQNPTSIQVSSFHISCAKLFELYFGNNLSPNKLLNWTELNWTDDVFSGMIYNFHTIGIVTSNAISP